MVPLTASKIKIDLEALIIKIRIGSNKIISLFSFPKKVFRVLTLYRHIGAEVNMVKMNPWDKYDNYARQ